MPNSRVALRQWIKGQVETGDEFRMPDIAKAAVAEFEGDDEFCRQFVRDHLYSVAYDAVQMTVALTRGKGFKRVGDLLVNQQGIEERRKQLRSRWASWLEHSRGRTIRLPQMTRLDLIEAARERRGRAAEEVNRARFLEELAAKLEDGQTVGDRFSTDDIQVLWEAIDNPNQETQGAA